MKQYRLTLSFITFLIGLTATTVLARMPVQRSGGNSALLAVPAYCTGTHNAGRFAFGISNNGTMDQNYGPSGNLDCFTGEVIPSFEYPKGSNTEYLFGASFWIGAVKGLDTLVSVGQDGWTGGAEFNPDESPIGDMIFRSTIDPTKPEAVGAVSEEDYIAVYTDTFTSGVAGLTIDVIDNRPHLPLDIRVDQRSYMWSQPDVDDIVLFEIWLKNIGTEVLNSVYLGIYDDADVMHTTNQNGFTDDITGFIKSGSSPRSFTGCSFEDTINLAWIADNDGDLNAPLGMQVPNVTGITLIAGPTGVSQVSYNWWMSNGNAALDYGPQTYAAFRDFGTGGTGTPEGDRNKYHTLRNGEIDFDQVFTASISPTDPIWMPPNDALKLDLSDGFDTRYCLSVGGFDLNPGDSVRLVFAYVGGENLHTSPTAGSLLPNNPQEFYDSLDFSTITDNAIRASWIYDNPGVDTDSDGYAGEFKVCNNDTVWFAGDGVPDFRASSAPASPVLSLESLNQAVRVRWNGFNSETSLDVIAGVKDFEGYNVYITPGSFPVSFAKVGSYDVEDYVKYYFDYSSEVMDWVAEKVRYTTDELRCLYAGGGCFDSSWYAYGFWRQNPYRMPGFSDSVFYFDQIHANSSKFGWETPILKSYPAAMIPPFAFPLDVPDSLKSLYLTPEGLFKYYEYEMTIANLLPNQQYTVAVSAFDYGVPGTTSPLDESFLSINAKTTQTLNGPPLCCTNKVGNIDADPKSTVDVGDLTRLIDYLFISGNALDCPTAANIDGDMNETVDLSDLTLLIDYLFLTNRPLRYCN